MLTLLVFILILSVLILIHEYGHYITAKRNGIKVEEFGFGFPPRLFSRKRGGTLFSINAIPFGGFVKMKGEDGVAKGQDSFSSKSIWVRIKVVLAGVFFNFLLAVFILTIGYATVGLPQAIDENVYGGANIADKSIVLTSVLKDSPADKTGLRPQDKILEVNGKKPNSIAEIQNEIKATSGTEVSVKVSRNSEEKILKATPTTIEGESKIGISMAEVGTVSYSFWKAPLVGLLISLKFIAFLGTFLWALVTGAFSLREVSQSVAGPVGIFNIVGQAVSLGLPYVFAILAQLSVTLAVINVLPFPALDGSRILFLAIEKIRGKRVNERIEAAIHAVGFGVLILLLLLITYNDVGRFFR